MKRRSGYIIVIGGFVIVFLLMLVGPNYLGRTSDPSLYSPNASDGYDPNDSWYTAAYISDGLTNNLDVSSTDTDDYYQFYMNRAYRIVVNINWTASADLDLALYDGNYNQINESDSGINKYENVSYIVQSSGYYYIRVHFFDGTGTIKYSLFLDTSEHVNAFNPVLFLSIFIPIMVLVAVIIVVAVVVHKNNKHKVVHPSTTSPARPWQPASQPTVNYAPQPRVSYAPQPSPYASSILQNPVVNAPPKPESKGRFCHGCGAKLEPAQRFCHNCGMEETL